MRKLLRAALLTLALVAFLIFCSFTIIKVGPMETITVGQNVSPWFKWSRVRGVGNLTERWEVNVFSWSALGLPMGLVFLYLRSRVKG